MNFCINPTEISSSHMRLFPLLFLQLQFQDIGLPLIREIFPLYFGKIISLARDIFSKLCDTSLISFDSYSMVWENSFKIP